jgi:hypothetical protein
MKRVFVLLLLACSDQSVATDAGVDATAEANADVGPPAPTSTIVVGDAQSAAVPGDFLGINLELATSCALLSADASGPAYFEQLFANLGHAVLHVNGHTADIAAWQPTGTISCKSTAPVVTQALVDQLVAFAKKIGWTIEWGLNLISNDPATAASEATYVASSAGTSLLAFNIGNEPEGYVPNGERPSTWTFTDWIAEWRATESAVHSAVPQAKIHGPDVGGGSNLYAQFVAAETSDANLVAVSHHFYATQTPSTIATLLAPATFAAYEKNVATWQSASALPFELSEMNSYSNGGIAGVTDTLAASLFLADAVMSAAFHGVRRAWVQQSTSLVYDAFDLTTGQPTALYYGLLLAHEAMHLATFRAVTLTTTQALDAYALDVSDGSLRVVVFDKDAAPSHVHVTLPKSYSSGSSYALAGPSLDATANVTLDGRGVSSSGTWSATSPSPVMVSGTSLDFDVAAGTAVVASVTP